MARLNYKVHVFIDKNFYDNLFEPTRKNLSKQLGKDLKQHEFTSLIKGFKIKKLPDISKTFKNSAKFKKPTIKFRGFNL